MTRNLEALLPGQELVRQGIADLSHDQVTDYSLLVLIAAPRLKRLGIHIPERPFPRPYEHQLYAGSGPGYLVSSTGLANQ